MPKTQVTGEAEGGEGRMGCFVNNFLKKIFLLKQKLLPKK
jgi:hypothetical protein